jgi:tetratricopeptide (TPR) repeat protein
MTCTTLNHPIIILATLLFLTAPLGAQVGVLPPGTDPRLTTSLRALRDAAYNYSPPADVERMYAAISKMVLSQPFTDIERNLVISRMEFLVAKSLNDSGDRKKAIPHFEAALEAGQRSMALGEHTPGLMAVTKAISELCIIKDMAFLVANGPKISQNARKILAMEPGHTGAILTLAAAKAYPPAIFGGNPKEAIAELIALLAAKSGSFEKDELFDVRVCIATASSKLDKKEEARFWFTAALELYPHNAYALRELEKVQP